MTASPSLQLPISFGREPKREGKQLRLVREAMEDGRWRTLDQIREILMRTRRYSTTSISARLRELRKFDWEVEGHDLGEGLWEYQIRRKTL